MSDQSPKWTDEEIIDGLRHVLGGYTEMHPHIARFKIHRYDETLTSLDYNEC
jgi:hypothetical protein